jgi:hypothetical protein
MNLANKIFSDVFKTTKNNKTIQLHNKPIKDKGKDKDYYEWNSMKKGVIHQADILYMPEDDETNEKYILVVCDVVSRLTDARGLKTMDADEIIENFKEIYKGDILQKQSFSIHFDQGFNNKKLKNILKTLLLNFQKHQDKKVLQWQKIEIIY